jgi:hypothetical protein
MSTFYYLVRVDNKTFYELGKSNWYNDFDIFKIEKTKKLLPDYTLDEEEENNVFLYNFSDKELLLLSLEKRWPNPETSKEYREYVLNGILEFCGGENVYLIHDCADFYSILKHDKEYVQVGSIYTYK